MSVTPEITVVEADEVQVVRVLEPGSVWIVGDGVPDPEVGKVGDLYLDAISGDIYGPKASSGWGAEPVANITPSSQIPAGGAVGSLLVKNSATDYDITFTDQPTVDKIGFDQAAAESVGVGEVAWNDGEGTLDVGMKNGVVNQLGQELVLPCRNGGSTTLANGTAVRFAGTIGNSGRLVVDKMVANGTYPGYVFFGITTQSIAAGQDGYVTVFGKVRGINTNAFEEGDILWCNPAIPGGLTRTEPEAPNLKLAVAAVISKATNGILMVRADTGCRLMDLHDVDANGTKDDLDILNWNDTTNRWEPTDRLTLLEQRVTAIENTLP